MVEKKLQKDLIAKIQQTSIESISTAFWNYNETQLAVQLRGISQSADIIYAGLTNQTNQIIVEVDKKQHLYNSIEHHEFPLIYTEENIEHKIGFLKITLTMDHLYHRIQERLIFFFLTQALKTFLVSLMMLLIFRWFIFRHLHDISIFMEKFDVHNFSKKPKFLNLKRKKTTQKDELSVLTKSINKMISYIHYHEQESHKIIERKNSMAINAAKLASLGEMAAGIAHEVNNPLAIIQSASQYSQNLISDSKFPEKKTLISCHEKIDSSIERISNIIDSLWRFAGKETQETMYPIDLADILENTKTFFNEKSRSRGVEFTIIKSDIPVKINCISSEIEQIVVNLLNNSFSAINDLDDKWVRLECKTEQNVLFISISDSGKGIKKSIADKVMDPFFTTKEIGEGTGLGLSISVGLAHKYGGNLILDTKAPNTTFILTLPVFISEEKQKAS